MNRVALDLGFVQIYWYSIMILIGLFVALLVIYREVKKQNINIDFFTNLAFYSIIIGIIGARLYYVLFNIDYYSNNVLEIFEIWNGGLAIHGGIIAGGLFALVYCLKHKVDFYRVFDICVVGLIIAQAIGRWGNFFNQEAYGMLSTREALLGLNIPEFVIKGMYINGNYYHPTFLYESIWNIAGFVALLLIRWLYKNLKTGQLTGFYLIWYSLGRIFIEGMRTDSLMLGNIKVAQLVSIILIIIGILLVIFKGQNKEYNKSYRKGETNEIRF
jgi:phosphatidylglycerol:prolipoprotein diacylglycerol transferase